jgi:hypothetical protein
MEWDDVQLVSDVVVLKCQPVHTKQKQKKGSSQNPSYEFALDYKPALCGIYASQESLAGTPARRRLPERL